MTFLKSARNVDDFTYFNQSKSHNRRENISKFIRDCCVRICVYEFIGIYKNIIFFYGSSGTNLYATKVQRHLRQW